MRVTWISLQRGDGDLFDHFGHIINPYTGIHIQLADGTGHWFILYTGFLVYMHFFHLWGCVFDPYLELET